jgi:peptidoglycan/xylan/chitin deacetylase (PgdA/CDA1 family)
MKVPPPAFLVPTALWLWRARHGLRQNAAGPWSLPRRLPTDERRVWLTVDDGPTRYDTEGMLEALGEYSARASFFLIGKEVSRRPHLVRKMVAQGHGVENHSHSHRSGSLWWEPRGLVEADLARAQHTLRCAGAPAPRFFRAPAGRWSRDLIRSAQNLGLCPVGWSVRGNDGLCCGHLQKAMDAILRQLHPGAIVLIHQGGRRGRVQALRYLLHGMAAEGWQTCLPQPPEVVA